MKRALLREALYNWVEAPCFHDIDTVDVDGEPVPVEDLLEALEEDDGILPGLTWRALDMQDHTTDYECTYRGAVRRIREAETISR